MILDSSDRPYLYLTHNSQRDNQARDNARFRNESKRLNYLVLELKHSASLAFQAHVYTRARAYLLFNYAIKVIRKKSTALEAQLSSEGSIISMSS